MFVHAPRVTNLPALINSPEDEIRRYKERALQSLEHKYDRPGSLLGDVHDKLIYDGHPGGVGDRCGGGLVGQRHFVPSISCAFQMRGDT